MSQENIQTNQVEEKSAFERNREKGQEARKALMDKFGGLFKRFGRGVDATIGAGITGVEFAGKAVDAGVGAAVAGGEFVVEKYVQSKENVVATVDKAVEGVRSVVDSGVNLTQDVYESAKGGIFKAKDEVFLFTEGIKNKWENWRTEIRLKKQRKIEEQILAAHQAEKQSASIALEASRAEFEKQAKRFQNAQALISQFKFSN